MICYTIIIIILHIIYIGIISAYILSSTQVDHLCTCLAGVLYSYYSGHWYPLCPSRGQAYRCLRHNAVKGLEPLVLLASVQAGVNPDLIVLPPELTVWIDPDEVGYRFAIKLATPV